LNFKQGESKERREQYLTICIEQLSYCHDKLRKLLIGDNGVKIMNIRGIGYKLVSL